MSKYLDDSTRASDPGSVTLSPTMLKALEPELFTERTFKCSPHCPVDHPAAEMRARFAEHLKHGDSRAALVVALRPLVVAAYTEDLDAAVLLRFPDELAARYHLELGSRLLGVNTFTDLRGKTTGKELYAVDLIPGPNRTAWSNFTPFIAEFLSDDTEQIEQRKHRIDEAEWRTAADRAKTRIERLGLDSARSGKPTQAGIPNRRGGSAYFQPIEAFTQATTPAKKSWLQRLIDS